MNDRRLPSAGLRRLFHPLLLTGFVATGVLAADPSDMAARAVAWEKAFNARDLAAVAAQYSVDAVRLQPQGAALKGRAAIQEQLEAVQASGVARIAIEVLEAETNGKSAWAHGRYELLDDAGNVVDHGPWMNVSRKIDGEWKITRDIWNSSKPRE